MNSGAHILVVDDEPRYLRLIRFNLEVGGCRVSCAETGEEGVALAESESPDLVVLDVMLPGIDGFEACQRIRENSSVPIIMLTARGADEDKVRGLHLGADDYVTKPFSAQVLLARVEAVLRRSQPVESSISSPTFTAGDLEIDYLAQRVSVAGVEVRLSPTEYRLLCCLAEHPGEALGRDELLERVWGTGYSGEHEILRVALWRLRNKLGDDAEAARYIVTRPGVGYMFAARADL